MFLYYFQQSARFFYHRICIHHVYLYNYREVVVSVQ